MDLDFVKEGQNEVEVSKCRWICVKNTLKCKV